MGRTLSIRKPARPMRMGERQEVRRAVRRIAVITGTRAEYGLLKSTMRALSRTKGVQLQIVATGMHLLGKFGHTVDQIRADGWRIDASVKMQNGEDGPLDQAEGLACGVAGIAEFLQGEETDIAVVLGDRIEAMAGALATVTTGKVLAHIHGGDLAPGDLDDSLRHAITKLAHLHLAATRSAARRIIRMGEAKERVHVVGAPGLDDLRAIMEELRSGTQDAGKDSRRNGCGKGFSHQRSIIASERPTLTPAPLPGRERGPAAGCGCEKGFSHQRQSASPVKRALVVQHPCGRSAEHERRVMAQILQAVNEAKLEGTCIYPNSDRGSSGIIEAIEAHAARNGSLNATFRTARSLDREQYLRLLIEADVLIGNSSSGIIEAATAGTPAVDIGPRQQGREASGRSVIHAEESPTALRSAIARALRMGPISATRSVYGDGKAGVRIAQLLAEVPLTDALRRKVNSY